MKNLSDLILDAFKSSGYLILNKTLINKLGLINASVLSNYLDKYNYFSKRDNFDEWFYLRHKDIMNQLQIGESSIRKSKKRLIKLGILKVKRSGVPAKEWFKFDFERLYQFIYEQDTEQKLTRTRPIKSTRSKGTKYGRSIPGTNGRTIIRSTKYKENKDKDTNTSKDVFYGLTDHQRDVNNIIKYWNQLKGTTSHKLNEDSKTYQSIFTMISNLLKGLPIVCKKTGSPTIPLTNFLQDFNIAKDLWSIEYSTEEIEDILSQVVDYSKTDSKLSLQTVLWNPFAKSRNTRDGFSLFLFTANKLYIDPKYMRVADKLADIICPNANYIKRLAWASKLQEEVVEEEKFKEIRKLLRWYANHYSDKYTPKSYDINDFLDNVPRIKAAIERSNETQFNNNGSSKTNTVTVPPEQIINQRVNGQGVVIRDSITKSMQQASELISNVNQSELAGNLCSLNEYIEQTRPPDALSRTGHSDDIKIPCFLIEEYVYWLQHQDWIDNLTERAFTPQSKLFKKFIQEFGEEIGLNPMTGSYS